jgi:hypothetical protein
MHADLANRRRVLQVFYLRYQDADRAFKIAKEEMKTWFPDASQPKSSTIGNPGSSIRRLYEQRERAILQLGVAHLKLNVARQRLATIRRQKARVKPILFVSYSSH